MSTALLPENASKITDTPIVEQTSKSKNPYALYVFIVLLVATLLNGLDGSEFTSASTVIARELHLGIGDIGALASAFTIFLTISIIPIGLWADRAKRSHVIAACLAVWSLATALTGLASGFIALFVTRMFTGIGEAGYAPAGTSLVGDFFPEQQRGKVMSWLTVAGVVGPILGMVLGGMIAGLGQGTWRLAFLVTGIPGLVLALFAWRMREPARHLTGKLVNGTAMTLGAWKPAEVLTQLSSLLRIKTFVCLTAMGVLTSFTATAMQTYFPTLLQQHDAFGLTSGQAGVYAGLVLGPTALVGILLGGYLADSLKRRYQSARLLICVVSILLVIPFNIASLLIVSTHNIILFSIIMVPTFFINTLHLAPLTVALLDVVPAEQRASGVAISVFLQRILGTAFAPLVIGMLAAGFDPSGLHFLHNMAGHDLVLALLSTCPLAFIGAGIVGVIGLRWIRRDQATVEICPQSN